MDLLRRCSGKGLTRLGRRWWGSAGGSPGSVMYPCLAFRCVKCSMLLLWLPVHAFAGVAGLVPLSRSASCCVLLDIHARTLRASLLTWGCWRALMMSPGNMPET